MTLKKIILLLLATALFAGFTSCSKDDDNPGPILGRWQYTNHEVIVKAKNPAMEALIKKSMEDADNFDIPIFTMIFNEDGTYSITDEDGSADQGTYKYSGNKLTIKGNLSALEMEELGSELTMGVSFSGATLILEMDMLEIMKKMNDAEAKEIVNSMQSYGITKIALALHMQALYM